MKRRTSRCFTSKRENSFSSLFKKPAHNAARHFFCFLLGLMNKIIYLLLLSLQQWLPLLLVLLLNHLFLPLHLLHCLLGVPQSLVLLPCNNKYIFTLTSLWANIAVNKLMLFFPENRRQKAKLPSTFQALPSASESYGK